MKVCTFSQSKTDFQFGKNALEKLNQTNPSDQAKLVGAKTNSACKGRSVHKTLQTIIGNLTSAVNPRTILDSDPQLKKIRH